MTMHNKQPLVSIGVPVYNGGEHLEECLNSILKQTYPHWECVIIDNASTDDTNAIARKFVNQDERFRLHVNPELVDQTTNWNISFAKISPGAKYFKIVCADDWIFPDYLEKMVAIMEEHDNVGMCSSYRIDDKAVGCTGLDIYHGPVFVGREVLVGALLNKYNITGSINTLLVRVATLKEVKGYPEIFNPNTYHIDTELAFEVLSIADLGFVFQVLSYTRRHNETYTSLISNRYNTLLYRMEKELYKYQDLHPALKNKYKEIRDKYALFILKQILTGNKECVEWHRKYLDKDRQFSRAELMKILIKRAINKIIPIR